MADPRGQAVANLMAVLGGRSLDAVLAASGDHQDDRDRALAAELSYGVCRWYFRLDALVGGLLNKPLKRKDRDLHLLLMVGAYQLIHSRVPVHAALSTTVETTRHLDKGWASGLVNGVLRRLQRELDGRLAEVDRRPALRYAQPDWLYRALRDAWPAQAESILDALQRRPPMTLRVAVDGGRRSYAAALAEAGITSRPHATVGSALVLDRAVAVERLPGFDRAACSVQDAGAQLAAGLMDLRPGQRVLDACAAPGGKTLAIAQHCPSLELLALDIDAERLRRVEQNLQRGGLSAELHAVDAAGIGTLPWARAGFDRILVDAPCSTTGVLRRHPDIRLLRRAADIASLARRQREILDAMWALLRPGGRMLYCTCSLLPEENAGQIDAFLARHAEAQVVELPVVPGIRSGQGVQLLPGIDDTDGFFYAAVSKPAAA